MQAVVSVHLYIAAEYLFNDPNGVIRGRFGAELNEIRQAIQAVDVTKLPSKVSKESTMMGKRLLSPKHLNPAILSNRLYPLGWATPSLNRRRKIPWDQPSISIETRVTDLSTGLEHEYTTSITMDGLKNRVGLEVQFGKYAFLGWDVLGKMPIFYQMGKIVAGVEVVPMASMRGKKNMSTGIGCFEQIQAILEQRGPSDLDIPVLLLGIAPQQVGPGQPAVELEDNGSGEDDENSGLWNDV